METLIDFKELSANKQIQAIEMLAKEFYGSEQLEKGRQRFHEKIASNIQTVKCMIVDDTLAAISSYCIYQWEEIAKQLYFEPRYENRQLREIRLISFGDLISTAKFDKKYPQAFELDYTLVIEKFRGKRLHTKLFRARLNDIARFFDHGLVFTLARSIYAGKGIDKKSTDYLLSVEKAINGNRPDGSVNISGIWVSADDFRSNVGVDLAKITPAFGTETTIHLAQKFGFINVGFYRNLSPVFATDIRTYKRDSNKV